MENLETVVIPVTSNLLVGSFLPHLPGRFLRRNSFGAKAPAATLHVLDRPRLTRIRSRSRPENQIGGRFCTRITRADPRRMPKCVHDTQLPGLDLRLVAKAFWLEVVFTLAVQHPYS